MAIDFTLKDVLHKVAAKLTPVYLPEAACPFGTRKPYNLRAVLQPELDGNAKRGARHLFGVPARSLTCAYACPGGGDHREPPDPSGA
jgi:hypothetical protein